MSEPVLVLNVGSSSLRFALLDPRTGERAVDGHLADIGGAGPADLRAALGAALDEVGRAGVGRPEAVGHRVVHGGPDFDGPALVDDAVLDALHALEPLAPLHLPGALAGIEAARVALPDVPQVAVFDTSFHSTLPDHARTYAVPREWRDLHGIRRYGFHGSSYAFVGRRAAQLLGREWSDVNLVLLHLGSGASACAVAGGTSVDTSMGLSPTEGLVMGTRSGDLDPSVGPYLSRVAALTAEAFEDALNHASGLAAFGGPGDMVDLEQRRDDGDPEARLGFDLMAYRLRKYIGAYAVALGRVDAIVFTGGIGEHSPRLRAAVLGDLEVLGVELDGHANREGLAGERLLTAPESRIPAFVVPTDEEWEIARSCLEVLAGDAAPDG